VLSGRSFETVLTHLLRMRAEGFKSGIIGTRLVMT
jgi:hypothetical protein